MLPAGPKQVELIEIINKPLLLHLVGYLYYWQMGFNSVFKGLSYIILADRMWYGHLNPQVTMVLYVSSCCHFNAT